MTPGFERRRYGDSELEDPVTAPVLPLKTFKVAAAKAVPKKTDRRV
jgi:hypothetical protein